MSAQDLGSETTYSFPTGGRKEYTEVMQQYGYVEIPEFDSPEVSSLIAKGLGYFCGTCASMSADPGSATGYWCLKFSFPDRPFGCCDGFSPRVPPK